MVNSVTCGRIKLHRNEIRKVPCMPKLHDLVQQSLEEIMSLGNLSLAEAVEIGIEIIESTNLSPPFGSILVDHFKVIGRNLDTQVHTERTLRTRESDDRAREVINFYFSQFQTLEKSDPER